VMSDDFHHNHVEHLDEKFFANGVRANQLKFNMRDFREAGEMAHQQFFYSSFSMLFASAALSKLEPLYLQYRADQDVFSSFPLKWRKKITDNFCNGHMKIQPDSAAVLKEHCDVFGMMEMKASQENSRSHFVDCDKCVVATAATLCALNSFSEDSSTPKLIKPLAIPFVIVEGTQLSLYVTRLKDGVPYVSTVNLYDPGLKNNDVARSPSDVRWRCFAALAILLNDFIGSLKRRPSLVEQYPKGITPKREGDNPFSTQTKKSSKRKRQSSSERKESSNKREERSNERKEKNAMEAALCDGRFRNVVYPFTRNFFLGDDGAIVDYQNSSPFYFKGEYEHEQTIGTKSQSVFLKVWKVDDLYCVDSVQNEWTLHWRVHNSNVPVAVPLFEDLIKAVARKSGGREYLVAAMEFVSFDEIETIDQVLSFSVSLISAVGRMHSNAGVLHCDLKPSNVRWSNGVVKLIDFGHAQLLAEAKPVPGTRGYEAPEVERGEVPTIASDAYSVGMTISYFYEKVEVGHVLGSTSLAIRAIVDCLTRADASCRMTISGAHQILENLVNGKADDNMADAEFPKTVFS